MIRHLRYLASRAGAASRLAAVEFDFGEVVAVLIVVIGMLPFAIVGL